MTRLAIFTTHPIQYQAPWFRALAQVPGLDVEVVFSRVPDAAEQGAGFGQAFSWDIPLRDGYSSRVLGSRAMPGFVPEWARRAATGIGAALDEIKPDVAMVLGWQELSLTQSVFACRRRGVPVVLRGESNALRERPSAVRMVHARYFSLFEAFLAIGRSNAELYRRAGIPEARIAVANYFVDNEFFRAGAAALRGERAAIRAAWGVPEEACCLAFVGKLEPKKRVMDFLGGVERARDAGQAVHALVVGSGEQMDMARALVADRRLPASFAGFLNQSQICRAYVAADALALPSDYGETWGLVVNEAMATGIPAIVSDHVGCANDLVLDGVTGRVFSFADVTKLGAAMAGFAIDGAGRARMGAAASERVSADYSIERAVSATLEVVELAKRARANGRA